MSEEYITHLRGLTALIAGGQDYYHWFNDLDKGKSWGTPVPLPKHPFDLAMPALQQGRPPVELEFCGNPGGTDSSVSDLIRQLSGYISQGGSTTPQLRVISVQCDPANLSHHAIYFEAGFGSNRWMCGGCTDFSGTGGNGRRKLESVFRLLALVYGVEIERVEIPYHQGKGVAQQIDRLVYEYNK